MDNFLYSFFMEIQNFSILIDSNLIFKLEDDFISSRISYSVDVSTFGFFWIKNGFCTHILSESLFTLGKYESNPSFKLIKWSFICSATIGVNEL